jgi:ribose 1,5-bisphosphokinase
MLGTLILVVGPSGVGKDTLLRGAQLLLMSSGFRFPRRWITYPDDRGEDHIPVTAAEFEQAVARGLLALHWSAHGLRYGIPTSIDADLAEGYHVIANVSRSVVDAARTRYCNLRVAAITAPEDVVRARLIGRGRESDAEIELRIERAWALTVAGPDVAEFINAAPVPGVLDEFGTFLRRLVR